MNDRQPQLDPQTWESLLEVYQILGAADQADGKLNPGDLSHICGILKTLLMLNSIPPADPRSDAGLLDTIKQFSRGAKSAVKKFT